MDMKQENEHMGTDVKHDNIESYLNLLTTDNIKIESQNFDIKEEYIDYEYEGNCDSFQTKSEQEENVQQEA